MGAHLSLAWSGKVLIISTGATRRETKSVLRSETSRLESQGNALPHTEVSALLRQGHCELFFISVCKWKMSVLKKEMTYVFQKIRSDIWVLEKRRCEKQLDLRKWAWKYSGVCYSQNTTNEIQERYYGGWYQKVMKDSQILCYLIGFTKYCLQFWELQNSIKQIQL